MKGNGDKYQLIVKHGSHLTCNVIRVFQDTHKEKSPSNKPPGKKHHQINPQGKAPSNKPPEKKALSNKPPGKKAPSNKPPALTKSSSLVQTREYT